MSRKGRKLEKLVELLESCLAPEGAEIKSPDYIPDKEAGIQREVDVSIRMTIGSVPVLVIIECRDRQDVEDVTWIEQVVQKRDGVNAAKAVAVTSSRFSQGAQKKADFHGIETRKIEDISANDIVGWFKAGELQVWLRRAKFHSVRIEVDKGLLKDQIEVDDKTAKKISPFNGNVDIFVRKSDGALFSLNMIWQKIPHDKMKAFYDDVPKDGNILRRKIALDYPSIEDRFQLPMKSGMIDVSRIILDIELWIERSSVPIQKIYSYRGVDKSFVQTVEFGEIDVDGVRRVVSIFKDTESGRFMVTVRSPESGQTNSL